ncbi:MAG: hypothetical protein LBE36_12245 [Flavobacteriaceae bacterium]|jgi:hypothetical protein|nr:hypothetical protein [Flavobacteriaceae bacterium]
MKKTVLLFLALSLVVSCGKKERPNVSLHKTGTTSESGKNYLNYNGLSFSYPDGWEIEKEVLEEDLGFSVTCEKKGLEYSEIFSVTWFKTTDTTPEEILESMLEGMKQSSYGKKIEVGSLYDSNFKGLDAVSKDYNLTLFGETSYGRLTSFVMNGNTTIISKSSDSKSKLDTEFQMIEESFKLK